MRRHLTYANIVSTLCLVLLLSGTAFAATKITGKDIKNRSVTGKDIKDASLSGKDVKDASVSGSDLTNNSASGTDLLNGSVTGTDLLNGSVSGDDLLDGSVTSADLLDSSLSGDDLLNGSVSGADLDGSVTGDNLLNGSVNGDDLLDGSVTGADVAGLTVLDFGIDALPGAKIVKEGGTVPDGGSTALDMNLESFDTGGMTAAGLDTITVQVDGTYLCLGTLHWQGADAFDRQLTIVINGTARELLAHNAGSTLHSQQVSAILRLSAGQAVSLGTFQNSGSAAQIAPASAMPDASLTVQMIST